MLKLSGPVPPTDSGGQIKNRATGVRQQLIIQLSSIRPMGVLLALMLWRKSILGKLPNVANFPISQQRQLDLSSYLPLGMPLRAAMRSDRTAPNYASCVRDLQTRRRFHGLTHLFARLTMRPCRGVYAYRASSALPAGNFPLGNGMFQTLSRYTNYVTLLTTVCGSQPISFSP
jgi:hypothetical protein